MKYDIRGIITMLLHQPSKDILFIVPSEEHFNKVILPQITKYLSYSSSLRYNRNSKELTVRKEEGSILFRAPSSEGLKGVKIDFFGIDEAMAISDRELSMLEALKRR